MNWIVHFQLAPAPAPEAAPALAPAPAPEAAPAPAQDAPAAASFSEQAGYNYQLP